MKKIWMIFFCSLMLAAAATTARAGDWSDLDEGEHELVGSEYERNYSIPGGFIVEKGKWENHSTWHVLNLIGAKEYPRYSSSWWLPFYYHLESRIDRREKKFTWLGVPYYRVRDLDHEFKTFFPFYTEKTRPREKDWNILYVLYGGRKQSEAKKESYFGILPVMYYRTMEAPATDMTGMMLISPIFFRYHREGRGAAPFYQELNISPLHFYHRNREDGERTRTWGAPLLPLVYYHSTNTVRHINLGWLLFDAVWNRESGMVRRSFLTPLWYYERDFRSASHFQTLLVTPFNFYRHYTGPVDVEPGDTARVERYQWWFPIVPLYYRFTSTETGSHTNLLWLLDWSRDTDRDLKRLWIIPLSCFYQRDSYFHFLAPVALMSWREFTDSYYTGIWGFHHVRRSETNREEVAMRRWWAPIVPLIYSYSTPSVHHVNVLGPLFDIRWKNDNLQRFFTLPLLYYQKDRFSDTAFETTTMSFAHYYRHYHGPQEGYAGVQSRPVDDWQMWFPILPLVYRTNYAGEGTHTNVIGILDLAYNTDGSNRRFWLTPLLFRGEHYFHILPPVYMSWFKADATYKASILGFSYASEGGNRSAWWVPIVPLYYHSYSPEAGSYNNFLWLMGWAFRPDGSFNYARLWPLAYYKSGEGGTRYILPLYVRPGGWTEREGYSVGLLPLPYYCRWEDGQTRVRNWMPLYWSWNDITLFGKEHTTGNIALPLWISYKDETNEFDLYFWGWSKSISMGPFSPSVMLGLGNRDNTWYLDAEGSWLYNAFSISTRTPIRNPFRNKAPAVQEPKGAMAGADTGEVAAGETNRPRMSRRREISRDTSLEFWGMKILFGWLCYEQADTQRHFRLFPLAWYSWDKASENKIINFLIFFYSRSGDQMYHVLFPLYGFSRDGDSYFDAYLLSVFWNEYDAPTREREVTALWPFINAYWTDGTAPDGTRQSGWRVFPLIWHKYNRYANGYERSRTISPLYYGYETSMPNNESHQRMTISPVHYYWSEERNSGGYATQSSTFYFPVIPLFYLASESRTNPAQGSRPAETFNSFTNFLIPIYYYNSSSETRWNRRESTFWLLAYYTTSVSYTMTDDTGAARERTNSMTLFPGFYKSVEGSETHYNILFLFDTGFDAREDSGYHTLIPLYYYSWDRPAPGSDRGADRTFMFPLIPLACLYEGNSRSGYLFMPLALLFYWGWDREENTYSVLGLLWINRDPDRSERYTHFLPLWMSWSHTSYKNPRETDSTVLVPFIPLLCLYDGTDSDGYWLSLGTLSYHGWEGNASRWTVLGFFWKYHNQDSTDNYLHILPFWMSWEDTRSSNYHSAIPALGLYWHSRPGYRHVNWLLLVDYERWESSDTTEWDFLLGIVSTRHTPRMREFEVALGLIASYENQYNSPNWHARMLWFGYERAGNRSTLNFLPLFYRRTIEGGSGYDLYRFPLAFWHYESNGQDIFHTIGFGLGYYRNYNAATHEDTALVLLGSLFYYEEKPIRNSESWGSLWGYLWKYEQEDGGAYNKFTILGFLFKRVNDHGYVYYWSR